MTIKEIKKMYEGEYVDLDVYEPMSTGKYYPYRFHTDNCKSVNDYNDNDEAGLWELMDEEEYDHSLLVNSCISADFKEWYDNKEAKVLCIMLKE